MPVRCERISDDLPGLVDGAALPEPALRHVRHCLRCQAASSRDRRVHRALGELATQAHPPPTTLYADIVGALDAASSAVPPEAHHRRRVAYVGTLAAATAAGVGGALVLAARGRRLAG
ncbi:hypothetical protein [Rhabdothermincola salaria]|uniref:hypothetical protein n=1 Tax=Rhabdothermincola salaria TaxID=2903142 RepID=UPI001E3CC14C|nr:hypothetical protein [Rhabdothermincola salaria]MCD9625763.1 hypothetical protein [Rhabdothermincola salaria]